MATKATLEALGGTTKLSACTARNLTLVALPDSSSRLNAGLPDAAPCSFFWIGKADPARQRLRRCHESRHQAVRSPLVARGRSLAAVAGCLPRRQAAGGFSAPGAARSFEGGAGLAGPPCMQSARRGLDEAPRKDGRHRSVGPGPDRCPTGASSCLQLKKPCQNQTVCANQKSCEINVFLGYGLDPERRSQAP